MDEEITDTHLRRIDQEYISGVTGVWSLMLQIFEKIDDDCKWKNIWRGDFFHPDMYWEWSLNFDSYRDALFTDLRAGKKSDLNCEQIKEILRLYRKFQTFDKVLGKAKVPAGIQQGRDFMTSIPDWKKLSAQTHRTLEAVRRKMPES